jgi:hypothetical protein
MLVAAEKSFEAEFDAIEFCKNLHAQAGGVYPPVRPPASPAAAEADIQQLFCVTPPCVHQMVLTLERGRLIGCQPGAARSIEVLIDPKLLPELVWCRIRDVTIRVTRDSSNTFFGKLHTPCVAILVAANCEKYITRLESLRETACVVAPLRRRSSP